MAVSRIGIVELIRSNLGVSMEREMNCLFIITIVGYGANIFCSCGERIIENGVNPYSTHVFFQNRGESLF